MRKILMAIGICLLGCVFAENASAIEIASNGDNVYPTATGSFYQKGLVGNGSQRLGGFLSGSDLVFAPTSQFGDPWGDWSQIGWDWNHSVPMYSLLSFSMTIQISGPGVEMYGFEFEQTVELVNTCEDFFAGTMVYGTFHCDYLLLTRGNVDGLNSYVGARTAKLNYNATYSGATYNIFIHPGSYVTLTNNSLSTDDRAWLKRWLTDEFNANNDDILDKLDEVIAAMPAISEQDIAGAVEDGQAAAREDEKEEYEEQQSDVDSGADDAGDEAAAATSNLIETGRSIIETIRDTPATNCVIRIQRGVFDTGNLNLCNVPQEIRTVISTVITIPVTLAALHIAYSVVMLYLNTVRKEQE